MPAETSHSDPEVLQRTRLRLSDPAKLLVVLAASAVVGAGYFLFAPVFMDTPNGWFACGSVLSGSPSDFAEKTCPDATSLNLVRAIALGVLAAVLAAGAALFGGRRVTHTRVRETDTDTDIDLSSPPLPEENEPEATAFTRRDRRRDDWA